jgi:hypothetical protein
MDHQFNLVDVAENEGGLDDLAKGFQRPIQRVLLRIGIESPEFPRRWSL